MAGLGYAALLIAWVGSLGGFALALGGGLLRRPELATAAGRAVLAVTGCLILATALLIGVFVARDYTVQYVYTSSSNDLSWPLTVAAVYSGQKGSLLYWAFVLGLFGCASVAATRRSEHLMSTWIFAVVLAVEAFFLTVMVFITNPFERFPFSPEDGLGLNPLLVDSGMLIHPPLLLAGFASTTIPFGYAIAALATGRLDTRWLADSRRFTLVSWTLLSAGNLMGAWWAYHVLGWGGYWGWDPVENSAILPWFAMTAYLHSVMVQERRGMLKAWNLGLILAAFLFALLGTFNVRSGILTSVHSFAESSLGPMFLTFFLGMLFVALALIVLRSRLLASENDFHSLLSREAGFVVNNFLILAIMLVILGGTFYPIISEAITGERITVTAEFFETVNGPLLLALVLLVGVGPLLPWREGSPRRIARAFVVPASAGVVLAVVLFAFGVRSWLALLALAAIGFTFVATAREFFVAANARRRSTRETFLRALGRVVRRDHRRFGGYTVHLGVAVMSIAAVGTSFFQQQERIALAPGESASVGRYDLTYRGTFTGTPNGDGVEQVTLAPLSVSGTMSGGDLVTERRYYRNYREPSTTIPIRTSPIEDLYVVLQAFEDGKAIFVIFVNPLVMWLWVGGAIVLLGAWMTLWPAPERRRVIAHRPIVATESEA